MCSCPPLARRFPQLPRASVALRPPLSPTLTARYGYERLDGNVHSVERQHRIDRFNRNKQVLSSSPPSPSSSPASPHHALLAFDFPANRPPLRFQRFITAAATAGQRG